jgi:hypothetical protein
MDKFINPKAYFNSIIDYYILVKNYKNIIFEYRKTRF